MNPDTAPRALRCIMALIGRRNAGKSSLINALTGQEVAIVSAQPGTTTDAVAKPYELLPLGPVTFFDTAGLDDDGELGELRIKATRRVLYKSDMALIVVSEQGLDNHDKQIIAEVQKLGIPFILVFNKSDLAAVSATDRDYCQSRHLKWISVSAATGQNIEQLKQRLIELAPSEFREDPLLVGDLISPGDTVMMVVPIDLSAPKGRLILPQVQVLREILDCNAVAVVTKESKLAASLSGLKQPPALVITDSQVVLKVAATVPSEIKMTTFSTLFARYKGDIDILSRGAAAIDRLQPGDRVLIAEACSHHTLADDIGKVKIPRWLQQYCGGELQFEFCAGGDFPDDLEKFALVVHCGACMLNRTEMIRRLRECERRGVAVTNYGIAISKTQGVLERIMAPFSRLHPA